MTAAGDRALRSQVAAALRSLAREQRQIICLAHFQKLTLRQIADRTGIPIETVQWRATEALRGLKDALEGGGAAL